MSYGKTRYGKVKPQNPTTSHSPVFTEFQRQGRQEQSLEGVLK
jgi:hypothetical protein